MEQIRSNPRKARRQAVGAAAQAQQPHGFAAAIAAVLVVAEVALQAKVLRQGAVPPAHARLAQAQQLAGLHGAAAELKQIEQADVVQELR